MTSKQQTRPVPIVDVSCCSGCGLCVRFCPNHALILKDGIAIVANPQACRYDGYCERICPLHAINRPFEILCTPKETIL